MDYLAFVSWGMYTASGTTATINAHYFVSWGIMRTLHAGITVAINVAMHFYRRLRD